MVLLLFIAAFVIGLAWMIWPPLVIGAIVGLWVGVPVGLMAGPELGTVAWLVVLVLVNYAYSEM